jgi:hypothetical protein
MNVNVLKKVPQVLVISLAESRAYDNDDYNKDINALKFEKKLDKFFLKNKLLKNPCMIAVCTQNSSTQKYHFPHKFDSIIFDRITPLHI